MMIPRRSINQLREAKPFTPTASSHVSERFYVVHLVDGTYELFRHFYGLRRFNKGVDRRRRRRLADRDPNVLTMMADRCTRTTQITLGCARVAIAVSWRRC